MAVITPPFFLQAGSHAAETFRQLVAAIMGVPVQTFASAVGLTANGGHGVVGLDDLKVTQRGAGINLSVDVAAGYALIVGTSSLAQGVYGFVNDAATNVPLTTAHATLGRIDLICAQVRDNTEDGSGSNDARLMAVAGTPAASPAVPTPPAGALVLAQVVVAAADTTITNADITDRRVYARTQNRLPWGVVGRARVTVGQTGMGAGPTDLTSLSVSFTAVANRLYKITAHATMDQDAAASANITQLHITDGSNTVLQSTGKVQDHTAGADEGFDLSSYQTPSAGAITYKLRVQRSGLGLVNMRASATDPAFILVEDIGPAV